MGDIKTIFKQSLDNLNTGRAVAIPYILAFLVPFVLIVLLITATGASAVISGIFDLKETRDQQRIGQLFSGEDDLAVQESNAQLGQEALGLFGQAIGLLTFKNLVWSIVIALVIVLSSAYISCFAYAMILLLVKAEEISLRSVLRITHRNIFRFIFQKIFEALILFLPALVFLAVTIFGFIAHPVMGVFFIFLFAIVWTIYIIYLLPRLMYTVPAMFVHDKGPWSSIVKSFRSAQNNIKRAWIVYGITYAFAFSVSGVIGQPMWASFSQMLSGGLAQILVSLLLFLLLLCAHSAGMAFIRIFIFNAYIDQEGP